VPESTGVPGLEGYGWALAQSRKSLAADKQYWWKSCTTALCLWKAERSEMWSSTGRGVSGVVRSEAGIGCLVSYGMCHWL
jgi:hypothetical protein